MALFRDNLLKQVAERAMKAAAALEKEDAKEAILRQVAKQAERVQSVAARQLGELSPGQSPGVTPAGIPIDGLGVAPAQAESLADGPTHSQATSEPSVSSVRDSVSAPSLRNDSSPVTGLRSQSPDMAPLPGQRGAHVGGTPDTKGFLLIGGAIVISIILLGVSGLSGDEEKSAPAANAETQSQVNAPQTRESEPAPAPAPVAEPEPVSTVTPEQRQYLAELAGYFGDLETANKNLASMLGDEETVQLILFGEADATIEAAGYAYQVQKACEDMKSMTAPRGMAATHELVRKGAELCYSAINDLADGIDNGDAELINRASEKMMEGKTQFDKAAALIDEITK